MRKTRGEKRGPARICDWHGEPGRQQRAPYAGHGEEVEYGGLRNNQTVCRRDAPWASLQKSCMAGRQLVPRGNDEPIDLSAEWVGLMRE